MTSGKCEQYGREYDVKFGLSWHFTSAAQHKSSNTIILKIHSMETEQKIFGSWWLFHLKRWKLSLFQQSCNYDQSGLLVQPLAFDIKAIKAYGAIGDGASPPSPSTLPRVRHERWSNGGWNEISHFFGLLMHFYFPLCVGSSARRRLKPFYQAPISWRINFRPDAYIFPTSVPLGFE